MGWLRLDAVGWLTLWVLEREGRGQACVVRPQDGAALKMAPEDTGADGAGIQAFSTAQALIGGMGALRLAQLAL